MKITHKFSDIPQSAKDEILDINLRFESDPLKEARRLAKVLKHEGVTQEKLSNWTGIKRSYIASSVRLLQLPEDVQKLLYKGKIGIGHAKCILSVPPEMRSRVAKEIVFNKWDVRTAQSSVKELKLNNSESVRLIQNLHKNTGLHTKLVTKESGHTFITFAFENQQSALEFLSKVENRVAKKV